MERQKENHSDSGYDIILLSPQVVTCGILQECVIVFNAPVPKHIDFFIKVVSEEKSSLVRADRITDTVLKFQTPGNFPAGLASISVHQITNQNTLCRFKGDLIFEPKVEAIQELLKTVSDPVSFLAEALNITDDNVEVDFKLEEIFRKNKPINFHLLKEDMNDMLNSDTVSSSRNPTLLHFAARYNLVRLCLAMVNLPGGNEALNLQNYDGLFPHDLAEQCENNSLAKLLVDAKEVGQNTRPNSSFADEIYEEMSPEIFQHYKEIKQTFRNVTKSNLSTADDDDDDENDYDEVYEDMSENGSESNSLSGFGLAMNGIDKKSMAKTNPLFEEMRRKNEEKKSTNMMPTTPPRMYSSFPKSCSSSSELEQLHEIYDVIPSRNNSVSSKDLYDILPVRNINNNNNNNNNNIISPTTPQEQEPEDHFDIYDIPVSKVSENSLYVPASFEQDTEATYDTLPAARLSLDFTSMQQGNENAFQTDRNGYSDREAEHYEDFYDVPARLTKPTMLNPLRNALSNQDLKQDPPKPPYNHLNLSITYDMVRKGKRHSEPVLQISQTEKQKLLRGQRNNIGIPVPPRNPINQKLQRRPLIPPPLPPQRSPIKR